MRSWARTTVEKLEGRVLLSAQRVGAYTFRPMFGASIGYDVAVQPDGKTVAVGVTCLGGETNSDVIVLRYGMNGWYDETFGSFGVTTIDVGGGTDSGFACVMQADGKIVIGGEAHRRDRDVGFLIRLNDDGSRDETFGAGGIVTLALSRKLTRFRDVALWNEKMIVAGTAGDDVAVARFDADGTLDKSFSGDGIDVQDFGGVESGNGIQVGVDGRVLLTGYTSSGNGQSDIVLARYRANGTLDKRFSRDGKAVLDFGGENDRGDAVVVDSAARIVVAGTVGVGGKNYGTMVRVSASGRLDESFGKGGWFWDQWNPAELYCLHAEADGYFGGGSFLPVRRRRVVEAHVDLDGVGTIREPQYVARQPIYAVAEGAGVAAEAGGADFVSGNISKPDVFHDFQTTGLEDSEGASPVIVGSDGKALLVGSSRNAILLVRENSDGTIDQSFGRGGRMRIVPADLDPTQQPEVISSAAGVALPDGSFIAEASLVRYGELTEGDGFFHFSAGGEIDPSHRGGFGLGDDSFGGIVAVQPDGHVVAAGSYGSVDPVVKRFDPLVSSASKYEAHIYPLVAAKGVRPGFDVDASAADAGDVLASGYANTNLAGVNYDVRLKPDGTLDAAFGDGGIRFDPPLGADGEPMAVAADPLGRMQRDGTFLDIRNKSELVRHLANGALDSSFGTGTATVDAGAGTAIVRTQVQSDGKILVIGEIERSSSIFVARLNVNGTMDTTFVGGSGVQMFDVGAGMHVWRVDRATDQALTVWVKNDATEQRFVAVRFSL